MKRFGFTAVLMVCVLHSMTAAGFSQEAEPAKVDTSSSSDIYNPPRVITPDYKAGGQPGGAEPPVGGHGESIAPPPIREDTSAKKRCTTCPGASRARLGGGGGFSAGYLFADLHEINRQVRRMGIPALSDNVFLAGGGGYMRIGRLLIGGAGYGGQTESSGIPDCCARHVRLEIGYGGMILGLAAGGLRYEMAAGMLFGGGSVAIVRERNSQEVAGWDQAWKDFYEGEQDSVATDDLNITSRMTGDFIALEPFASVKYWIVPFMALDLSASYLSAEVKRGEWKLDGVSIPDSPESNIGGWSLKLGLHFGV
jgi:hypothetical protein